MQLVRVGKKKATVSVNKYSHFLTLPHKVSCKGMEQMFSSFATNMSWLNKVTLIRESYLSKVFLRK